MTPLILTVVELPELERFDEAGNPLGVVGKEISERLYYESGVMKVIHYHRLRYGVDIRGFLLCRPTTRSPTSR